MGPTWEISYLDLVSAPLLVADVFVKSYNTDCTLLEDKRSDMSNMCI